jgi:hypothetical protein
VGRGFIEQVPIQIEFDFIDKINDLNPTFVMYKLREFDPSMLRFGEYTFNMTILRNSQGVSLDDLNWVQNLNELLKAHRIGKPIRELNPMAEGG